jgi:uncharacterized RDD family membrane protein YckC
MFDATEMPPVAWTPTMGLKESDPGDRLWDNYHVSLSPAACGRVPAPARKPACRPLAGRWARLAAAMLDGLLLFLVWAATQFALFAFAENSALERTLVKLGIGGGLILSMIQITLLARRGQTIGKMLIGIRVVRDSDESNPGFWHACVLRVFIPWLVCGVKFIGPCFALVDLLSLFGPDRRCLHDLIADTKVVEA